jgi:hypothetical protein
VARHIRTQKPSKQSNYRDYKPWLRLEFNHSCSFCEQWETECGGAHNFAVEHYRPKNIFKTLKTVYRNLFYACPRCNTHKGQYWPTRSQSSKHEYILNVCDHDADDEIDKRDSNWVGLKPVGKWNIIKLRLSSRVKINRRKDRLAAKRLLDEAEQRLKNARKLLKEAIIKKNSPVKIQTQRSIMTIQEDIAFLNRRLERKQDKD